MVQDSRVFGHDLSRLWQGTLRGHRQGGNTVTPESVSILVLVAFVLGTLYGAYLWERRGPDRTLRQIAVDARHERGESGSADAEGGSHA